MNPYILLLDNQHMLKAVDTRYPYDLSEFSGSVSSSWKKVITAGARKYYNLNHNVHDRGTYVFTYADKSVTVANPSKGDYIPPGAVGISRPIEDLLVGWEGKKCIARSRIIPLHGLVLNTSISSSVEQFCMYNNSNGKGYSGYIKGWTTFHTTPQGQNRRSYCYINKGPEGQGVKCRNEGHQAVITQLMMKEVCQGITRLRMRCPGATAIVVGSTAATRSSDGVWTWEGEALQEDTMLSIGIGSENFVHDLEFLDD